MPFAHLSASLQKRNEQGLLRQRRLLESPQGARVRVDGVDLLSFCSNDYLGLANHPALIHAACEGAEKWGVGAGASHLVTGHTQAHHDLEPALARFVGLPAALLFSTGYMANLGIVTALLGRHDAIFADKLNHASLNDAAQLSRARLHRYPHGSLAALEQVLSESKAAHKLVISDAVFSMDGDIAPAPALLALCEKYNAWLLLDDAHGFGVLGANGKGVLEHFACHSPRIIYMATLGKAAGVAGAFVAGDQTLIDYLVQHARSYVYTTAAPPLQACALQASLGLIAEEGWRRDRLKQWVTRLQDGLNLHNWHLMPSSTPIQPLVIGTSLDVVKLSERLLSTGILVPAIRPPTVPQGTARLRISLSAAHVEEDIDQLIVALNRLAKA
ncbi:MAG: 8-amino-7-oxononanoate synthase [Sulfuricellaceae bacterium]|nr:8-amino-7-oxononanoate synthase [Sulfuricellaceae bacterium]